MDSIEIIYEDEEIFIINKPSGLASQGGQGVTHSVDVDFANQIGAKVFLVHRLDKDTAGLMIVAKNSVSAGKWIKLVGSKSVKKEYIAICAGEINPKKGTISEDLIQHGQKKSAVTNYSVEDEWTVETEEGEQLKMCKIRLVLETGRMHQIRIHLAKQGCPIAGDDQHGNFKVNKQLKKLLKIKKLMLAAVKLSVPINGKVCNFETELPNHMKI